MADSKDPLDVLSGGALSGSGATPGDPVDRLLLAPLAGSDPLKAQVHLEKIAKQNPSQPLSDEEFEKDAKPFLQQNYPGADLDKAKETYGHQRNLERARDAIKDQSEGAIHYLQSRSIPWASRVKQIRDARDYQEAVKQFQAGNQNPDVYNTIAGFERIQQIRGQQGASGDAQDLLASMPSMLGEMAMGSKALGAIGKAVPSLSFLAPAAAEAGTVNVAAKATLASAAKGTAAFAARTGANLFLNPNMYLDAAVQNSLEKGGDPLDAKNLAPAVTHGALTVAILGNLTKGISGKAGAGVGDYLKTMAARTGVGITEQALTDVAASGIDDAAKKILGRSLGLDTKYGTIGTIMRGENDGMRQLVNQAMIFGAFGVLHGREGDPVKMIAKEMDKLADQGLTKQEAVPLLADKLRAETPPELQQQQATQQPEQHQAPAPETVQSMIEGLPPEEAEEIKKYASPRLAPEHANELLNQINHEQPAGERITPPAETPKTKETLEGALKGIWEGRPVEPMPEQPAPEPETPAVKPEAPQTPLAGPGPETANRTAEAVPTQPAKPTEAGRSFYHVADYKNPEKSVGKAIEMLDRKGSPLPYALHSWDGPNAEMNHEANLPAKGASLQFNREAYQANGQIEEAGTGTSFARSKMPVRYDPALEAVHYKGKEGDAAYERLHDKVEEINKERADGALMKEYGHDGPLPPVELKLERRAKPRAPGEPAKPELRSLEQPQPPKATRDRVAEMRAKKAAREEGAAPKPSPLAERYQKAAEEPAAPPAEAAQPSQAEAPKEMRPITETNRQELLARVFAGEGDLTPEEKNILVERVMHATSFKAIEDATGINYQTAANIEKRALGKLGHSGTVAQMHEANKGSQDVGKVEKGKEIAQQDIHTVDFQFHRNRRVNEIADANDEFNSLKTQIAKEQKRGPIPAEREADFIAKLQRLRRIIDEGNDETRAPEERQAEGAGVGEAGGPTPVRPGAISGGEQGGQAGENPAASAGGPAAGETGGPAPRIPGTDAGGEVAQPGGGEAGGNELKSSRAALVKYGFSPDDIKQFEQEALADPRRLDRIVDNLERGTDESNPDIKDERTMMLRHLEKVIAASGAAGSDELIPDATKKRLTDLVTTGRKFSTGEMLDSLRRHGYTDEQINAVMDEAKAAPKQEPTTDERDRSNKSPIESSKAQGHHRQNFADERKHYLDQQLAAERGQGPITPAPDEEPPNVNAGADLKPGPLLDAALKDFVFGEEGSLDLARMGELAKAGYEKLKAGVRGFLDHTNKLAGAKFPKVSRLSPEAGNAAAHFDSAPEFGRRAAVDYIDRVLGKDASPEQAKSWGTAFVEERQRTAIDNNRKESAAYSYAAGQARAAGDQKAATKFSAKATERLQAALATEKQLQVGKKDSPLKTDADYQRVLNSQEYKDVMGRYQKELAPVLEQMFRQAEGMEDTDPIRSRTQIPGRPFTAKALDEGPPEPAPLGSARGNVVNRRVPKLQAAREAGLDAENYETDLREIINHTIQSRATLAAKAKMAKTLIEQGLAWSAKPGERVGNAERFDRVFPDRGTPYAPAGETDLWVTKDNDANKEIRQVLQVDRPATLPIIKQAADASTWGSLISTLEAAYHTKNNLTFLFKPGVNPIEFAKNIVRYVRGDPTTMKRLVDLAEIGASQDGHAASRVDMERTWLPHPLSGEKSIWTARTWTGRFLETIQSAMRLTADSAFDTLQRQGRVEGSEQNRRDFINQLGNYSKGSQSRLVVLLRDLGVGPFATAGSNYIMQGVRSVLGTPGATATSWKQAVGLRAEQYARVLSVVGATALANYFKWGRLDGDDNTPLGHYKWGDLPNGKSATIDFTAFTGLPRGMRQLGLMALAEGYRKDTPAGKQFDQAATSAGLSALHPMFGPLPSFAYTAATGRDIMGSQLATKVSTAHTPAGVMKARLAGKPEAGSSQIWENLKAALWHSIPLAGTLSGHGKPEDEEKSIGDRATELLGPFGTQERGYKAKKAKIK